jgi:ribosomal protein S12 methylthiotransferase
LKTKNGKPSVTIVTLGCSKNLVDSEVLIRQLQAGGIEVSHNPQNNISKRVIINTCGFINDAKEESIDTILNFVNAKQQGIVSELYVMGCLSERYRHELSKEIPEVDGFLEYRSCKTSFVALEQITEKSF